MVYIAVLPLDKAGMAVHALLKLPLACHSSLSSSTVTKLSPCGVNRHKRSPELIGSHGLLAKVADRHWTHHMYLREVTATLCIPGTWSAGRLKIGHGFLNLGT